MQRPRSVRDLFSCLGLFLLFFFPALNSFAQQADSGNIIGQIRISGGNFPNQRIAVNLVTRGALVNTSYTDDEGRFAFYALISNLYHVSISEKDYQAVSMDAPLRGGMTINLEIVLVPSHSDPAVDPRSVSGGNPYLANLEDYAKRFPPRALKEFEAGVNAEKSHADDAVSHYQKSLKLAPEFYPARNNLGSVYLNQGNLPAAEAEFERVIRGNPDDAAAYFNLGNVFLVSRRYDEAGRTIQEGLQKQPNSALGNFLHGSLLQQTNHNLESEKDLRRALELDPGLLKAHLALVNLYLQEHRPSDAIIQLKDFLKAAPNDSFAPKARQVLKKLEMQAAACQ